MSELNRQNVSEKLEAKGVDSNAIKGLIDLIDECEFAKYAPSAAKDNMSQVYDEGVVVINGLEDSFKKQKTAENEG